MDTRRIVRSRHSHLYTMSTANHTTTNGNKTKKNPKKFKIVSAPKKRESRRLSFRLFDFQTFDTIRNGGKMFRIQMFGINESGKTCALFVDDFQPFFYVKIPSTWASNQVYEWYDAVKKECKYNSSHCLGFKLEKHSQLYDFTANQQFHFAKCIFRTVSACQMFRRQLYNKTYKLPVYESKIPPLLRYFHIYSVSPSGWVDVLIDNATAVSSKTTTCHYEFLCTTADIVPLPEKETPVPYKICSFDIEASSSHGDFPVPIKDYKRVASQFVDVLNARMGKQKLDSTAVDMLLKNALKAIFGFGKMDGIDTVYPKEAPTKEQVKQWTQMLLTNKIGEHTTNENGDKILQISQIFEQYAEMSKRNANGGIGGGNGDDIPETDVDMRSFQIQDSEESGTGKKKNPFQSQVKDTSKTMIISNFLLDHENTREEKINTLNEILTKMFPPLEGDRVTFIGTTFLKYGDSEPYKNHCIVVDSCDNVAGAEIVSVKTEAECLLEWTLLIQEEDPDIIIGYNIFGFDYQFMFHRSCELQMVDDFCAFSRVQGEPSCKYDETNDIYSLDHTQNRLASGDYDLHYPMMSGRLQIDLLFYFRRDYNLSSYKLDDVAGTMIRDDIKGLQTRMGLQNEIQTELYSKNLSGLHEGDFIHIEISSFTTDYYMDGKKFRVLGIDKGIKVENHPTIPDGTYNVLLVEGDHTRTLDVKKMTLKWGMAKDDVSPQDIFRLSKESSTSRAVVAKYCIQDCNLVHHLMKKVDVLTGYIEMARICNVPIRFLVFRGQGIKLTSYVAKVCREKQTLMPDLEKNTDNDGYEGAIVLPPKCAMYAENPVACVDYSSLYPSIAKGWNLSPNSKVWTKNYDLDGNLIKINDKKVSPRNIRALMKETEQYDNLPDHQYIEVEFDSFETVQKYTANGKLGRKDKVKSGKKVCRWAQFPNGQEGIIPCIIGDLLKARKETRVKAESEPDPFIANVLDKRQLGYKVTANSLYGQMGSSVSTFFEKDVAASITSIGRMMITYAKRMVEEIYGDSVYTSKNGDEIRVTRTRSQYVYGDSVASYTPIYVRICQISISIVSIEELGITYGKNNWIVCTEEGKQDKEYCELKDIETWTDNGWTPLHRIIRHKLASHKQMIRVLTHTGLVDVTDDHSLLCAKTKKELSPKEVQIGTKLLHHTLPTNVIESTDNELYNEFIANVSSKDNTFDMEFRDQISAAHICYLAQNLGWSTSINTRTDKPNKYRITMTKKTQRKDPYAIKKMHPIPYEGYVYDLTTENHHFSAGIGNMVVHNTDSVFFTFNLEDPETGAPIRGKEALEWTIEIAQEAAHLCSLFLPPPMKLAYEKTLMSFILLSKKRYVGMLYEFNPNKGKLKFMGLPLKRRDSCDYLKDVYGGILTILMKEPDNVKKAIEFLNQSLQALVDGNVSMDKLALTKSLRSDYKNPDQIAHKVLAERIGEREPGNKPKPGDRIKYAFIENKEGKLLGERIETPQYITDHNLKLDYHYYITNQLMNPLQQLFSLATEKIYAYQGRRPQDIANLQTLLDKMFDDCGQDIELYMKKREKYCSAEVKKCLFDPFLTKIYNTQNGIQTLMQFYQVKKK